MLLFSRPVVFSTSTPIKSERLFVSDSVVYGLMLTAMMTTRIMMDGSCCIILQQAHKKIDKRVSRMSLAACVFSAARTVELATGKHFCRRFRAEVEISCT